MKGGGTVQLGRAEQMVTAEQEKLKAAHEERRLAIQKQTEIDLQLLDGPALATHKQMAAGRKTYDDLASQISVFEQEISAQRQAQEIFAEMLIDEHGNSVDHAPCPTCTQTITKAFISGRIGDHKKLEDAAVQQKTELEAKQKALGDIAAAEAALKANEAKVQEKLEQVKKVTATGEKIAQIEKAIGEYQAALEKAKAEQSQPADTSALDALNSEIQEWEGKLSPAVQYESTLKQIEESQKRWEEQNVKVNDLETLCSYFGPKGIKAKLIAEHIGAFEESVNSTLSKWGYRARLSIEPYAFEVQTPRTGASYLPLKEMSGFESMAFSVALQSAIAIQSKIRMIVIDEADTMIGTQRNKLFGSIKALVDSKALDQAIILLSDPSTEVPKKDGVGFYGICDGKIHRM